MQVTFWGVRGSVPTPEASHSRYGGNTLCVEVKAGDTRIALDAGIGLRWLVTHLMSQQAAPLHLRILLAHPHWDHIQGIPFTPIFYMPSQHIEIHGVGPNLKDKLQAQLRPDFCPVPNFFLDDVGARLDLCELPESKRFPMGETQVRWALLPRGRRSLVAAYRIEWQGKSLAYLTDVEYPEGPAGCPEALELAHNADLLIHDSQFLPEERATRKDWGHSTHLEALELARLAGARQVALYHHDPARDDEQLDALAARVTDPHVFLAREGLTLQL